MWLMVGAVILGIFLVNQFGAGTILGGDELGAVSSFTSGNFRGTGQKFSGSVQLFDGVLTGNNKNCESYAKQIAPYLVRTENVVANWEPVGTLKNCQCRDIYSGFYVFPPPPSCPKGWTYSETTGDRGPWSDIGSYKYSYDESTVEGNYNCDNLIISKGTPTDYARLYTDININQLHTEDDLISSFVANRKCG